MKTITTLVLILLGTFVNAQQNYFSRRCAVGCDDGGLKIIPNGNNFVLVGAANCFGPGQRSVFLKLDSAGNILLEKIYGADWHDYFSGGYGALLHLQDSSYLFAGAIDDSTSHFDVLLYKLTNDGDSIWIKQYGDSLFQSGWQARSCRDGSIIMTGQTGLYNPLYNDDVLLIKTDSAGNLLWQKNYGGPDYEIAVAIDTCFDGGYIITGYTKSYGVGGGSDFGNIWIVKTDSAGNISWTRTFGDIYDDGMWNGIACHDGSFAFAGYQTIFDPFYYQGVCCDGPQKLKIIHLDSTGNTIFEKTYGRQYDANQLYSIKELPNGDLIAAGWYTDTFTNHFRGVILKVDPQGDSLWMHTYEFFHGANSDSYLYDIAMTSDNGFIATGSMNPLPPDTGGQDTWVLRVDSNGCEVSNCLLNSMVQNISNIDSRINVYPNPSQNFFNFRLTDEEDRIKDISIFNYIGEEILFSKISEIDLTDFSKGIYFYKVITKHGKNFNGKIVKD